jgi:hypothetical protein
MTVHAVAATRRSWAWLLMSALGSGHYVRLTSPSNIAISVWPLADPLLDWEVLT